MLKSNRGDIALAHQRSARNHQDKHCSDKQEAVNLAMFIRQQTRVSVTFHEHMDANFQFHHICQHKFMH